MNGEFFAIIFFVNERVFYQAIVFEFAVLRAVGHIAVQKEPLVKGGGCCSSDTETGALNGITTDVGIHRTKLKLALVFFLVCLYITRGKDRHNFLRDIENGDSAQFFHQHLNRILLTFSGALRTMSSPILFGATIS